jgi:hypothetical protein
LLQISTNFSLMWFSYPALISNKPYLFPLQTLCIQFFSEVQLTSIFCVSPSISVEETDSCKVPIEYPHKHNVNSCVLDSFGNPQRMTLNSCKFPNHAISLNYIPTKAKEPSGQIEGRLCKNISETPIFANKKFLEWQHKCDRCIFSRLIVKWIPF